MDHIAAVPQHIKKRELQGLRPASYYVPEHLIQPLTEACSQFYIMSENTPHLKTPQIYAVKPDEKIKLRRSYHAVAFPTVHRVKSQGYMVYHTKRTLKSEFMELPPKEIGAMVQKGVNVHDRISIPEIAYTGDTTFEVFTNSPYTTPADLLKVKLLIVEATYMNDDCDYDERVSQARQWGHIHLSEIYENAELFKDVENILLIHMSDKYSVKYIEEKVYENIPESLQNKIHISTLAKDRYI
ncbi:hypothetical protein DPMN_187164 [Dreissena polymorpha]|uniref:Uncharacterized protein n=2 Tax=Dreissena polymorpha TaxID=45954 RepID=A0A9D4IA28_DREPO|nr:hypothetical protein DPMN_187164 [Dreissena polymorpha]